MDVVIREVRALCSVLPAAINASKFSGFNLKRTFSDLFSRHVTRLALRSVNRGKVPGTLRRKVRNMLGRPLVRMAGSGSNTPERRRVQRVRTFLRTALVCPVSLINVVGGTSDLEHRPRHTYRTQPKRVPKVETPVTGC